MQPDRLVTNLKFHVPTDALYIDTCILGGFEDLFAHLLLSFPSRILWLDDHRPSRQLDTQFSFPLLAIVAEGCPRFSTQEQFSGHW